MWARRDLICLQCESLIIEFIFQLKIVTFSNVKLSLYLLFNNIFSLLIPEISYQLENSSNNL
jgi:hypothetical protein